MQDTFFRLADELSSRMGIGAVHSVHPEPMEENERGFSGARLVRLACVFSNGKTGSFVCKHACFPERTVMQKLTEQKRGHTPFSYADLSQAAESAWFIMQDVRSCGPISHGGSDWKRKVAAALADIYTDNFECAGKFLGLPHADEAYWNHIATQISVDHFERQCERDNAFAKKYAGVLTKLRRRAEVFVKDMTALYREGSGLTVTHGDLQITSGDHVRCFQGKPMIIDWGFSRYAAFYIDLVDYFAPEEALLYLEELNHRGVIISKNDFEERFRAASCYPAFIYLYPALMQYNRKDGVRLDFLLRVLCQE